MSIFQQQAQKRSLEKRFSDLYDFSLDIQRHEDDLEFSDYGGRIHYVFDENIFELFVRPFARSSYITRSTSDLDGEADAADPIGKTDQQTALLCAEALFSGRLPGQVDRRILLSEWHRWELLSRLNELMAECGNQPGAESLVDHMAAKSSLLRATELPENLSEHDALLDDDIAELSNLPSMGSTALLPVWRNRSLAALIAGNETVEPLQQLRRLLSPEIQKRLQGLVSLRRPIDKELDIVTESAKNWVKALRTEVEARAARMSTLNSRSNASLNNDGKTLALLEWVSSRLGFNDRVVLVTGDAALYDTYRRKFEESISARRTGERLFLLRRPTQYAPLFTAAVNRAELDPHLRLFYSIQQAVELPIAPLRMASIAATDLSQEVLTRRNSLTLRPMSKEGRLGRRPFIHDAWRRFGHIYTQRGIEGLESELNKNERILNGFAGGLISNRISETERDLLRKSAGEDREGQRAAYIRYVEDVIAVLAASAVALWTPIAKKFLREALVTTLDKRRRYVPVAVNIAGSESNPALEAIDFMTRSNQLNEQEISVEAQYHLTPKTPFDIFLSSSAVALIANDWQMAEHFSEVAINVLRHFAEPEGVSTLAGSEAYYLCAVAKRFRLGLVRLDDRGISYKSARRIFTQIKLLQDRVKNTNLGPSKSITDFRSNVEYSGACLFFSIHCFGQSLRMEGILEERDVRESYQEAHHLAGGALESALTTYLSELAGKHRPNLGGRGFEILCAQFLVNVAAWTAIAPLIRSGIGSFEHRPKLRAACATLLTELEPTLTGSGNELFRLEILAFKIAEGIDADLSRMKLKELANNPPAFELEVDRLWFTYLTEYWIKR